MLIHPPVACSGISTRVAADRSRYSIAPEEFPEASLPERKTEPWTSIGQLPAGAM